MVDNYVSGVALSATQVILRFGTCADSFFCTVLIAYEYVLTLDAEVLLFWRKKISISSILFFLNRYLVLLYQLSQLRRHWVFTDSFVSVTLSGRPQAVTH